MAKKTIRELSIRVNSKGAAAVEEELRGINKEAVRAAQILKTFEKHLYASTAAAQGLNRPLSVVSSNAMEAAKGMKAFMNVMNTSTKAAQNRLEDFVNDVTLMTLYIKDLGNAANTAGQHLAKMKPPHQNMSQFESVLEEILVNLQDMSYNLEEVAREMVTLNNATQESIHTLDRLGDRITDVERQTKKQRIETENVGRAFRENAAPVKETTRSYEKQSVAANKLANDTRRLSGRGSQNARAFSDLAFRMNPMVSLYASIAVNVYALSEAFRVLNEAANLGRLQEQSSKFAATLSGIDIKGLSSDLQELSGFALASGEALRQSVRGVSYGFTADELERLTVGARKASVALGINFADAIDRAFRGIAKQEVEVLDEIGVVTRLDTAFRKYGATLGKRADELNEVERRTALTVEVISQLEKRFSSFDTTATGLEQVSVATKNLVDSTLIAVAEMLDGPAKGFATLLRGFNGVETQLTRVKNAQEVYNNALKQGNLSQAAVALDELREAQAAYAREQKAGTKENQAYLESVAANERAQTLLSRAITIGYIAAGVYAFVLGKALVSSAIAAAGAVWSLVSAISANIARGAVVVSLTYALAGAKGVLAIATGSAATAMWSFAAGVWAAISPAVLLVGAIALVATALGALINYFTDGWLVDTISEFFSWIGEKISEFLEWLGVGALSLGESAMEGLDSLSKQFNVDNLVNGIYKIDGATKDVKMTTEEYLESLKRMGSPNFMAASLGTLMTRDEAEANLKYLNSIKSGFQELSTAMQELEPAKTGFNKFAQIVRDISAVPASLVKDSARYNEVFTKFKELQEEKVIPMSIQWNNGEGFRAWGLQIQELDNKIKAFAQDSEHELSKLQLNLELTGDPETSIKVMKQELSQVVSLLDSYKVLGEGVDVNARKELDKQRQILELQIEKNELAREYQVSNNALLMAQDHEISMMQLKTTIESDITQKKIEQVNAQLKLAKSLGQDTEALQDKLVALNNELALTKEKEALQKAQLQRDKETLGLEQQLGRAGTNTARLEIQKQLLAIEEAKVAAMAEGVDKELKLYELALKKKELEGQSSTSDPLAQAAGGMNSADFMDMSEVMNSVGAIEGLTSLQSTFANTIGSMSSTYSDFLAQAKDGSTSFSDYLSNNTQAMADMIQGSVALAQQAFAMMSQAKIDGINREIEAEKRRDGKSAESQKKIKQLEAKRIKEEARAKKASIVMSTAAGIMNIWAGPMGLFPPAAIAMSAALGVMGMMQLGQIDKAASGQIAGLNAGGSNLSLSGGQRSKDIDVSQRANAGELAYLRGEQGTGSAQNFIPGRAGGGFAAAGTRITLGESGPEEVTPAIPVNVTSAGQSGDKEQIVFSPQYNLQAIDAMGMEELMQRHSRSLYEGLEQELNARNKSLNNL